MGMTNHCSRRLQYGRAPGSNVYTVFRWSFASRYVPRLVHLQPWRAASMTLDVRQELSQDCNIKRISSVRFERENNGEAARTGRRDKIDTEAEQ